MGKRILMALDEALESPFDRNINVTVGGNGKQHQEITDLKSFKWDSKKRMYSGEAGRGHYLMNKEKTMIFRQTPHSGARHLGNKDCTLVAAKKETQLAADTKNGEASWNVLDGEGIIQLASVPTEKLMTNEQLIKWASTAWASKAWNRSLEQSMDDKLQILRDMQCTARVLFDESQRTEVLSKFKEKDLILESINQLEHDWKTIQAILKKMKELNTQHEVLDLPHCKQCDGTGREDGSGRIRALSDPYNGDDKCHACHGTGRDLCTVCKGRRWV